MSEPYEIHYSREAVTDVKALRAYDQRKILDWIKLHLSYQPTQETKSRIKAMVLPFWSQYRLRLEDFRVYYDVSAESRAVYVLRVLKKTSGVTSEESP